MKVYGLYGKSGTGKSYQAMTLCKERDIESIIDDGLFIWKNQMMAGTSAKRQPSKIKAIKTALFTDEEHCIEVQQKIKELAPASILIIGTSFEMVDKIIKRLDLPEPDELIAIETITTEAEREIARRERKELGKHVVPVPEFQIKRHFSGFFVDQLNVLRSKGGKHSAGEKTVVRPTFSYLGKYDLSDKVISDIVTYIGANVSGIHSILKVQTEKTGDGVKVEALVLMHYGIMIVEAAKELQEKAVEAIETMTAFHIMAFNVEVKALK
ncbi:MAG: hypothetical protein PHC40_07400 [Eubacteriales bacterium]|nr:hypothetical protein [Eubacteriales bacterium]